MERKINYSILLKDFILVNIATGISFVIMIAVMLLQEYSVLPSIPCGMKLVLHMYCPGCGGTRAVLSLLHGHFFQSLYYNPAVILGGILMLAYEIGVIATLVKRNGKRYYYPKAGLAYGYIAVVLAFAAVRDWLLVGCGIDMLQDIL